MSVSAKGISRRQLLRGDVRGKRQPIRPPWAISEPRFIQACDRCGECVGRCPEKILTFADGGFPAVEFGRGECSFCGECVAACRAGALDGNQTPWRLKAGITDEGCLTGRGIVCRSCGEQCESGAIRFRLAHGGVARPVIEVSACTGCGACFKPCPVNAVVFSYHNAGEEMDHPTLMGASV